jgi:hypothetical protein
MTVHGSHSRIPRQRTPDHELVADELVELDAGDDHVAAMLVRRQSELLTHSSFDQRQGTSREAGGKGARPGDVAIALDPPPGQEERRGQRPPGRARATGDVNRDDGARARGGGAFVLRRRWSG